MIQQILWTLFAGLFATVVFGTILDKAVVAKGGKKFLIYYICTSLIILFGHQFILSLENPSPIEPNEPIIGVP